MPADVGGPVREPANLLPNDFPQLPVIEDEMVVVRIEATRRSAL
jgi:hypothetical protein